MLREMQSGLLLFERVSEGGLETHKPECGTVDPASELLSYAPTYDDPFIYYVTQMAIDRHLPGLRTLAKRKFPSVPLRNLAISIDHAKHPPVLNVVLTKNLKRETSSQSQSLFKAVQSSEGSKTIVYSHCMPPKNVRDLEWQGPKFEELITVNLGPKWDRCLERPVSSGKGYTIFRHTCKDDRGDPVETQWDMVDQVYEQLPFADASGWLGLPWTKRGDRIKALHKIVDEVVVRIGLEGEFGGQSKLPEGIEKLVLDLYQESCKAAKHSP